MAQKFESKELAEKAAKHVNEYLEEQEMYLQVETVELEDGKWAVAVVNCY